MQTNVRSEKEVLEAIKKELSCAIEKSPIIMGSKYKSSIFWTPEIRGATERAIKNLDNKMEKERMNREYYKIDTLFWSCTKEYDNTYTTLNNNAKDIKLKNFYWEPTYAIEYENNKETWTDELVKLSHIRAGMKIIITYSENDNELYGMSYEEIIEKKLLIAIDMLKSSCLESLNDSWLLIFMPNNELNLDMLVGYKMENENFVKI